MDILKEELPIFFMQVFIACGLSNSDGKADPFRKPKPGMWQIMEKHFNSGIPIDMDQLFSSSFYSFKFGFLSHSLHIRKFT